MAAAAAAVAVETGAGGGEVVVVVGEEEQEEEVEGQEWAGVVTSLHSRELLTLERGELDADAAQLLRRRATALF